MTHNELVNEMEFDQLKTKLRHLKVKNNALFMPQDTLVISQPNSREQLTFEIITVEPLHSRSTILGLYAPYEEPVLNLIT